ncbi:beta-ketoacyl synthase N-terminal-like domain-containing protein [Nocardiopsis alba]|uniref:beta-ketoacyl synthase N-terminal-like domain-containing protein n=1 Tax=Nocardiopsis alba TaxID=53437 RepID=UPI0033D5DD40
MITRTASTKIAIIGMACRFPASADVDRYWELLQRSGSGLVDDIDDPGNAPDGTPFVPVDGPIEGMECFDAAYFGISPAEAEAMDPQQRLFLEEAVHALEHAGYASPRGENRIGVFCGGGTNRYAARVAGSGDAPGAAWAQWDTPASLALRVSYYLNLRGPSVYVGTLCSTSLTAVHMASQSLSTGESDMCLAGAVTLRMPEEQGYHAYDGGVMSKSGRCRPFDAKADGTVPGSGVGIFVLKRLDDALTDGDTVHAVILGSAMNNDGADRLSFAAPSVGGQRDVIVAAARDAGVDLGEVRYVEAHGTGTPLGDPVEFAALREARAVTGATGPCAVGSVKSSVGHLDSASGAAGLLKAVLAVREGVIPGTLGHEEPDPRIPMSEDDLHVTGKSGAWPEGPGPRRAGVTSLGVGGTNVHMIIEEPPIPDIPLERFEGPWAFPLSADTPEMLAESAALLAERLRDVDDLRARDVATTLILSRTSRPVRKVWSAQNLNELVVRLEETAVDPRPRPYPVPVGELGFLDASRIERVRRMREETLKEIPGDASGRNVAEAFGTVLGALEALKEVGARPEVLECDGLEEFAALVFAGSMERGAGLRCVLATGAAVEAAREGDLDRGTELLELLEGELPAVRLSRADVEVRSRTSGETLRTGATPTAEYLSELAASLVMAEASEPTGSGARPGLQGDDGWVRVLLSLWEHGAEPDWERARAILDGRRIPLPVYPFERARHWIPLPGDTSGRTSARRASPKGVRAVEEEIDVLEEMSDIWSRVLGLERPSPDDDFFDVGGHSIVATQILSRIRERFGVRLDLGDLMDAETLQGMSDLVTEERESARLYSVLSRKGEDDGETVRL